MKRITLYYTLPLLFIGCEEGTSEKAVHFELSRKENSFAIYWKPLARDSIKTLIKDDISFSGEDTLTYLPSDRDLTLKFYFSGIMKEYMKYGKMVVIPVDSSVSVIRIDSWSFKLKVDKPIDGWQIAMNYKFSFEKPYVFSYSDEGSEYSVEPNDTLFFLRRHEMTKPGNPWDYY